MERKAMLEYQSNRDHFTDFLVKLIEGNNQGKTKDWVKKKIFDEENSNTKKAFFEAERIALGGFLERGEIESFKKLLAVFNDLIEEEGSKNCGFNLKKIELKVFADAVKSVDDATQHSTVLREVLDSFSEYRDSEEFQVIDSMLLGQGASSSIS